jgi:hypothetical protein
MKDILAAAHAAKKGSHLNAAQKMKMSQTKLRAFRSKYQIWPPTPRFTGVGQLWPVFEKASTSVSGVENSF